MHKHTNELINETSPYLLQHAHNPVDWHAWNEDNLTEAKQLDKPLLISIGYSSCHWCHVMEHESFVNEKIAEYMNEHFYCIKVDREERPDVDAIYMTAANIITGSGGWPLNCFALPDGKPFHAGTYYPPNGWLNLLQTVDAQYGTS
ncbi:thioredoxin domain-containing protein, partial [Bacteroidia bacterium]|nr:thioredoxin domain-containing protein [Bacteroidia bacterium]